LVGVPGRGHNLHGVVAAWMVLRLCSWSKQNLNSVVLATPLLRLCPLVFPHCPP
jgi:hypothetical protein